MRTSPDMGSIRRSGFPPKGAAGTAGLCVHLKREGQFGAVVRSACNLVRPMLDFLGVRKHRASLPPSLRSL